MRDTFSGRTWLGLPPGRLPLPLVAVASAKDEGHDSGQFVRVSCQHLQLVHHVKRANVISVPFQEQQVAKSLSGGESVHAHTSLSATSLRVVTARNVSFHDFLQAFQTNFWPWDLSTKSLCFTKRYQESAHELLIHLVDKADQSACAPTAS